MSESVNERIIFLNHVVSRTKSRSSHKDLPPVHSGADIVNFIKYRFDINTAIEFFGATDDRDDLKRIANGEGYDFIRIKDIQDAQINGRKYIAFLFECVDHRIKSLSVVHTKSLKGREIEGDRREVGAACAHVVIRLPNDAEYDDGKYRCAIEYVNAGVTRNYVETLFRRQLRRYATDAGFSFEVVVKKKRGTPKVTEHKYYPSFELMADVGRKLGSFNGSKKLLTSLLFTKRAEKFSTGDATDLKQTDFEADVDIRVSAAQAPDDPKEKMYWVSSIRQRYEDIGYKTSLFYRYAGGTVVKGSASGEVAGAADLLMCPKETVYLKEPPKRWCANMNPDVVAKMCGLIDRDELWESAK